MLGSKFVKFMSILKWQVSSSWIFVSLFIVMTHNSTVDLKLIHFLFWTKRSYQSSKFDTFKCSDENLQNSTCHFQPTSQFFFKFCITLQCHEKWLLCTFLAPIHNLLKRSPLKWKSLRLLSTQVKICQIPYTNFETTSQFLSKFVSLFSFMKDYSSVVFVFKQYILCSKGAY